MIQQEGTHHLAMPTDSLSRTGLPRTLSSTVLPIELSRWAGQKMGTVSIPTRWGWRRNGGGTEEGGCSAVSTRY